MTTGTSPLSLRHMLETAALLAAFLTVSFVSTRKELAMSVSEFKAVPRKKYNLGNERRLNGGFHFSGVHSC